MQDTLLTWMIFLPLLGIPLILLAPKRMERLPWLLTLAVTAVPLGLGGVLWWNFDPSQQGMQFVHHFVWIGSLNVEYFVGVDGLSITLVLLTLLISFIAAVASSSIEKKPRGYFVMFLLLETGMLGTFCALDFFLFYIFWEIMLLPMYFLIGVWGAPARKDADGRVRGGPYAAIKFFLYTLTGSVLMLLALIAVYYNSGPSTLVDGTPTEHTFNIVKLIAENNFAAAAPILGLDFSKVIFVLLFIGFAIKVPIVPFHTWLPDAHVEAPTPISVILAGILLKMGGYGILRFNFGMLPEATVWASPALAVIGMVSIVYAAFVCLAQKDLKKLIAYSSVSHMGFVLLGMAAFTATGVNGAVLQMVNHGLISPLLFLLVGVIYDRAHHRQIEGFGGLAHRVPEYTGVVGLAFMASLGLPGLAGFISEAMCFLGAFPVYRVYTIISAAAVIITAAYYLWTFQRMFLGELNPKYATLPDLTWRERFTLYPLAVTIVVMGFYPMPVLNLMNGTLTRLIGGLSIA